MISRVALKIFITSKSHLFTSAYCSQRYSVFKKKTQDNYFPSKISKSQQSSQTFQKPIHNQQQAIEQASTYNLRREIIKHIQSLPSLLALREQVFRSELQLIPFYLAAIVKHININNYHQNLPAFQYINEELNNFLQELAMSPIECLMMLSYRERTRDFQKMFSFMNNFGFQRKVTIVCASFIHKRQLEFNQAIYALASLLKLGSMSVLLFMNSIKFIKEAFLQRKNSITLLHLVTILNTNLLKRNEITLQNILYDHVLNHLLLNMSIYLKNEVIEMKIEVLGLLLVLDCKKYYRSNRLTKQLWIKKIIKEIVGSISKGWAREMLGLGGQKVKQSQLNWKHIMHIVECINFAKQNQLDEECFIEQFDLFITKVHQYLLQASKDCLNDSKALKYLNDRPQNMEHLFRLLFNQASLSIWLQPSSLSIYKPLFEKLIISTESIVYPVVDVFKLVKHNKKGPITKQLYKILVDLYGTARNNNLIVQAFVAQIIEFEAARKGMKIINELAELVFEDKSSLEPVLSYILLAQFYAKKFNLTDFRPPTSLLKLLDGHLQTPKSFINCFYTTIRNFRNPVLASNSLQSFSENSKVLSEYLQKLKVARYVEEEAFQILNLTLITYCNNEGKTLPLFDATLEQLLKDQVKKHQFLAQCYPERFPTPGEYYKKVNILTSPITFKRNFQIILKYFREPKYSYYLWDLLIKNYVRQPATVREECFQLLQAVFLEAYERQNLRKIILLMVLTNHISRGIVIAPKSQLKSLFQKCIDMLIKAQDAIEYHYHCYLQILINAIASNILSLEYLHKIKAHTLDKSPEIKNTTTLMLLMGATFAMEGDWQQDAYLKQLIIGQRRYLSSLIKGKRFNHVNQESLDKYEDEGDKENSITITGKIIAIYLRFKIMQFVEIKDIVLQFLQENNDFSEWMIVAYSFKPLRKTKDKPAEWTQFQRQISSILMKKLKIFKELGMLSRQHELAVTKYLK